MTNYERAFADRPDVFAARGQLNGAIKAGMDLRRYELATLAAAVSEHRPVPGLRGQSGLSTAATKSAGSIEGA